MPTNEQRRANAKRKLERQLERRAKHAKIRRIVVIAAGSIVVVAAVVAVVLTVINTKHEKKSSTAASSTSAAASSSAGPRRRPDRRRPLHRCRHSSRRPIGRRLPVPGRTGSGRQAGQAAADRQGADRPGPGERQHGDQPGPNRIDARQQRIALHGQQFREPDRPKIL